MNYCVSVWEDDELVMTDKVTAPADQQIAVALDFAKRHSRWLKESTVPLTYSVTWEPAHAIS